MKKIIGVLFVFFTFHICAEEIACELGSVCVRDVNHVEYSEEHAKYVLRGKFIFGLDSDKKMGSFIPVTFKITEQIKGNYKNHEINLMMPCSNLVFSSKVLGNEINIHDKWLDGLREANNRSFVVLEGKINELIAQKLASSVTVASCEIKLGSLDSLVRESRAVVFEDQEYVFFIFKSPITNGDPLFQWDYNLLPVDIASAKK